MHNNGKTERPFEQHSNDNLPLFNWRITLFSAVVLSAAYHAQAADFAYTGNLGLSKIHDDNIGLRRRDIKVVDGQRLTADTQIILSGPRASGRLDAAIKDDNLPDSRAYEADNKSLKISGESVFERGQISANGGYVSTTTLSEALRSGQAVDTNENQTQKNLGAQLSYRATLRFLPFLQLDKSTVEYDAGSLSNYQNYSRQLASAGVQYGISELLSMSLTAYNDQIAHEVSAVTTTTKGANLSSKYQMSTTTLVSAKAGMRRTLNTGSEQRHTSGTGRVLGLDLNTKLEKWEWHFSASEDVSPRFDGSLDNTQEIETSLGYSGHETWRWDVSMSKVKRTPENPLNKNLAVTSITAANTLSWMPREHLKVQAQYRFINEDLTDLNSKAHSNYVGLNIGWFFGHKN